MGPRMILVDGYNVIKNTPSLAAIERGSLDAGRQALIKRLVALYRHTPHRLVIVFDGDGPAESSQPVAGYARGKVVFSRRGEKADQVIIRLAAEASADHCEAVVFSDDLEVRLGAERHGAQTARVDDARRRMDEAPRLLRKRFSHQQNVRREMEGDDRDEQAQARRKGNARRTPRGRGRD